MGSEKSVFVELGIKPPTAKSKRKSVKFGKGLGTAYHKLKKKGRKAKQCRTNKCTRLAQANDNQNGYCYYCWNKK